MPPLALLVDRDADTRQMYAGFLRHSLYETDEAADGREALAKVLCHRPDIVVTETRLPGIDGFELCRILREETLTRDIPIVVVTGDAYDIDAQRAQAAGADTVLTKPCLPQQLLDEIDRVLTLSRELRAQSAAVRRQASAQVDHATELIHRSQRISKRVMLSRVHRRGYTNDPPEVPPALYCPSCDQPLKYVNSHIGGVSARYPEQWDYFECATACGTFQYRHRTRKLRRVDPVAGSRRD